jgi:hypothetical protein
MSDTKSRLITPARAATLLQKLGYRGQLEQAGEYFIVESAACGSDFKIYFFADKPTDIDDGCRSFQFEAGWCIGNARELVSFANACNQFNNLKRFAKAVIGDSGKNRFVSLQADVFVFDGISDEAFSDCALIFISLLQDFIDGAFRGHDPRYRESHSKHDLAIQLAYGFRRDFVAAADLYREAANSGFAGSQNNLGDLYETGRGVAKNDQFAIYWFTRAAERGEPTAYLSLSTLLARSTDDRDVLIEAAKFALLAMNLLPNGFNKTSAEGVINVLAARLSEDEFESAKNLAENWIPLFQETRLLTDAPGYSGLALEAPKTIQ